MATKRPSRAVKSAEMGLTITNNTGQREGQHYDWTLTLECGHRVYRRVRYAPRTTEWRESRDPDDALPAPRRAFCDTCEVTS